MEIMTILLRIRIITIIIMAATITTIVPIIIPIIMETVSIITTITVATTAEIAETVLTVIITAEIITAIITEITIITEDTKESVITKANATLTGIITMETKNTKKDTTLIHSHERVDDLNRNGYGIIQDPGRFCFGMDAVLLSDFAQVKKGENALDLGTGTGIIPILLEAKTNGNHFTGLEIQEESADMARRSVKYNNLEEKVTITVGDIKEASKIFGADSMEVITTNPPYMIGQHGLKNPTDAKAIARHEVLCNLDDILRESARILKPGGRFYMVHRPFRLAEIFAGMIEYKIEPKRMRLVYPFVDKEPNMVLIEGCRGGKSRITVEKPLIVYDAPGVYTDEIHEIYGI